MQNRLSIDIQGADRFSILIVAKSGPQAATAESSELMDLEYSNNILDGLSKITSKKFDLIAIEPGKFNSSLKSSIRTIRKIRPQAKIILLARMYQEPEAVELINSLDSQTRLFVDYAICPVAFAPTQQSLPAQAESTAELNRQSRKIEILEKLVMEDELTGVKNRRFVTEFLRQIINRAQNESIHLTVLIFDIDDFKGYNDRHGHPVGDSILKQAAILMQKCCRKQDVVGRIGGDEFAVVFWNIEKDTTGETENISEENERRTAAGQVPSEAEIIAERFRTELNRTDLPALGAEGKGILTISGGLAKYPAQGSTPQELLKNADQALLEAKRNGKNRVYLIGSQSGSVTAQS